MTKDSIRRRVALLITNIKFTDKKLNRDGAETDERNTEILLQSLGYEVVKHRNLTGKVKNKGMFQKIFSVALGNIKCNCFVSSEFLCTQRKLTMP